MELLTEKSIPKFHRALLGWFEKKQRDLLPWRTTSDPFAVLVAEKLLQQTSARPLVVDAYREIMQRYPTAQRLAQANPETLRTIIKSLGFVYRADEIISMAQELVNRYDGRVPNTLDELLGLPGIGQYCARAVLSLAFHQDIAVVDTNVARFLYRVFELTEPMPSSPASNKHLIRLAGTLVPAGRSRDYNLAVLDLCASVCTRNNPHCWECPVQKYCVYGVRRKESKADC